MNMSGKNRGFDLSVISKQVDTNGCRKIMLESGCMYKTKRVGPKREPSETP